MKYNEKVEFRIEQKEYDPKQGKEITMVKEIEIRRANITDASQEIMQVTFGDWRKGTKVIRLLNHLPFLPTHVLYKKAKYKVAMNRQPSHRNAFVVEEVTS